MAARRDRDHALVPALGRPREHDARRRHALGSTRRRAASRPTATTTIPIDPVPTIGGNNSVLTMTQGAQTPILPGPRDQRVLERRDDVLCYTSEELDAPSR